MDSAHAILAIIIASSEYALWMSLLTSALALTYWSNTGRLNKGIKLILLLQTVLCILGIIGIRLVA